MTFKVKVTYTSPHDESLRDGNWDTYFKSIKYPDYFKEFETKEELGSFILDLTDSTDEEIIVKPMNSEKFGNEDHDCREIEVYNDYRE